MGMLAVFDILLRGQGWGRDAGSKLQRQQPKERGGRREGGRKRQGKRQGERQGRGKAKGREHACVRTGAVERERGGGGMGSRKSIFHARDG